ncbi:MAG: DUF2281 domain-containing protein [Balneolaceae bacterium]|nr:DUF2281 domain-containing protein [Balneolaceae bacterium]
MSTTQLEKELIKNTKGLPEDAQQEIVDFAKFIRQKTLKKTQNSVSIELSKLSKSQATHLEEEFTDYKKLFPNV